MNILQIHKNHYLRDGASRSYFDTARLLQDHGHDVAFFSMRHPDNERTPWSRFFVDRVDYNAKQGMRQKLRSAVKVIYNRQTARNLEALIKEFKPDIAHLHNIYHQLSPSVIRTLRKHHIPIVMTLHDYKLICPNYTLFHNSKISYRGCGGRYYQIIFDKAIKNSYVKSALGALEAYIQHRWLRTYEMIDTFIAPSQCMKDLCVRFGIPAKKIVVVPHAVPTTNADTTQTVSGNTEPYFLYVGRLSVEKGVDTLLTALANVPDAMTLRIVGSGPAEVVLREQANALGITGRVVFMGQQSAAQTAAFIRNAYALVVPSVWLEVFGYVAIEALASGVPVIAALSGALPELVQNGENGLLYTAGDSVALARALHMLTPAVRDRLTAHARHSVVHLSAEAHYQALYSVYQDSLTNTV